MLQLHANTRVRVAWCVTHSHEVVAWCITQSHVTVAWCITHSHVAVALCITHSHVAVARCITHSHEAATWCITHSHVAVAWCITHSHVAVAWYLTARRATTSSVWMAATRSTARTTSCSTPTSCSSTTRSAVSLLPASINYNHTAARVQAKKCISNDSRIQKTNVACLFVLRYGIGQYRPFLWYWYLAKLAATNRYREIYPLLWWPNWNLLFYWLMLD